jgi:acyl-coenzyme A thioesterase PaaI-like protein
VFTALEEVKPIATINLRTDYIAPIDAGERAICAAECEAIRDDIAYVAGRLTLETNGQMLATGAGAFMVGTKGPMKGMRL